LVGIILTSFIVFWLLGFGSHRRVAESAVKRERKILNGK